jgi:hypothetical protein
VILIRVSSCTRGNGCVDRGIVGYCPFKARYSKTVKVLARLKLNGRIAEPGLKRGATNNKTLAFTGSGWSQGECLFFEFKTLYDSGIPIGGANSFRSVCSYTCIHTEIQLLLMHLLTSHQVLQAAAMLPEEPLSEAKMPFVCRHRGGPLEVTPWLEPHQDQQSVQPSSSVATARHR